MPTNPNFNDQFVDAFMRSGRPLSQLPPSFQTLVQTAQAARAPAPTPYDYNPMATTYGNRGVGTTGGPEDLAATAAAYGFPVSGVGRNEMASTDSPNNTTVDADFVNTFLSSGLPLSAYPLEIQRQLLNYGIPVTAGQGTNRGSATQPSTYTVSQPGQFGFQPGVLPGGSALDFLRQAGFPDTSLVEQLQRGAPLTQANVGRSARTIGNLGLPSPQSLAGLGPSGLEFLAGIFETLLGIPFQDVLYGAYAPFERLRSGNAGRTRGVGGYIE